MSEKESKCKKAWDAFNLYNPEVEEVKKWEIPKFEKVTGDLYKTKWEWYVTCPERLELGKNTDIGIFSYINARYGVEIGNNVQIGSHCAIYSHDSERDVKSPIVIRNNVLIGSHATILPRKILHVISKNVKAGSVVF